MLPRFQLTTAFPLGSLTVMLLQSWVLGVEDCHLPPSPSSFFKGTRKRALRHILSQWHLRVWGLDAPPSSTKTTLALEPWDSSPGGEARLDRRTGGSLEKVRGRGGEVEIPRTHPFSSAS